MFATLLKVDAKTRTIIGRASDESVDKDREVMDYHTSREHFARWTAETQKRSGGLSSGNLRLMHQPVVIGKVTNVTLDDSSKAVDIEARISDDKAWQGVLNGEFTGFSIGGRVAKKWQDTVNGRPVTRYTAIPSEISLVDAPCNPAATFFTVHKQDGSTMLQKFTKRRGPEADQKTGDALAASAMANAKGTMDAHREAAHAHIAAAEAHLENNDTNLGRMHAAQAQEHADKANALDDSDGDTSAADIEEHENDADKAVQPHLKKSGWYDIAQALKKGQPEPATAIYKRSSGVLQQWCPDESERDKAAREIAKAQAVEPELQKSFRTPHEAAFHKAQHFYGGGAELSKAQERNSVEGTAYRGAFVKAVDLPATMDTQSPGPYTNTGGSRPGSGDNAAGLPSARPDRWALNGVSRNINASSATDAARATTSGSQSDSIKAIKLALAKPIPGYPFLP